MSVDSKLDQIIEELAVLKTISSQHTVDLVNLQDKLEPVFTHVTSVRAVVRVGGAVVGTVVGLLTCLAGILLLFKN